MRPQHLLQVDLPPPVPRNQVHVEQFSPALNNLKGRTERIAWKESCGGRERIGNQCQAPVTFNNVVSMNSQAHERLN